MTPRASARFRAVRWSIQGLFLAGFVALFVLARYGVGAGFQNLFFRFDPLVFLVTSIAQRTIVVAALLSLTIIAGTLVFGRFFCGYVCPLGACIDGFDSLLKTASIVHRSPFSANPRVLKYLVFIFLFTAAICGASFLHFFDPLAILGRTLTFVFYPAATGLAGLVAVVRAAAYVETAIAGLVFIGILALGLLAPRFWCRNVCPLGGLLGLLSKVSFLRFGFTGECRQCRGCEGLCPTGAIDAREQSLDSAECIGCFACVKGCKDRSIRYGAIRPTVPLEIGWRPVLAVVVLALVAAPLTRASKHESVQGRLLRPPGSVPERDFLNSCLHCGLCMKVCPTNGLQPCILEAGVSGIWSPRLAPRLGACEKGCNACGLVCPTGAIRRLPPEEKSFARVGTAVVDRSRCIAWEQGKHCLICDEACPYDAISAVPDPNGTGQALVPQVDEQVCIGCGLCESRCPIEGPAAIQVFRFGEERKRTGQYRTEEKARLRQCGESRPEELPAGFIQE